ncbi:MAG: ABC transporter permease subunit [Mesorhizobium sp.]|nr:MAG: ABC transporter permease subunit [Mesorhizobium sp.]
MDARNDMLRLLHGRRAGYSLEQPFYTDADFFKLDMELIWYRDWLFIGHDCELPKPGSYITAQIGDYPVVLVRDQQGRINAFHNSCRHRGSRVCNADKGTAAKLVCPYHQWTYELDGRLLFARQMADGFDKSQFSLKPVACESVGGYIFICLALGLFLAILLDQKIRGEGMLRPIYLYPMALSFIVTGVAWKWFLDPGLGLEQTLHQWGWTSFHFDWIKNKDFVIYTVVIAGVWQASGFIMAMFLAGLRGIDGEIMKAAQIDGATTFQLYRRIVIPLLRPVFLSAFIVLAHLAIKSYDLVVALTSGGPGGSAWLPSNFMYEYTFKRNEMAVGSASAVIMLMTITAIIVPYLYSELRERPR